MPVCTTFSTRALTRSACVVTSLRVAFACFSTSRRVLRTRRSTRVRAFLTSRSSLLRSVLPRRSNLRISACTFLRRAVRRRSTLSSEPSVSASSPTALTSVSRATNAAPTGTRTAFWATSVVRTAAETASLRASAASRRAVVRALRAVRAVSERLAAVAALLRARVAAAFLAVVERLLASASRLLAAFSEAVRTVVGVRVAASWRLRVAAAFLAAFERLAALARRVRAALAAACSAGVLVVLVRVVVCSAISAPLWSIKLISNFVRSEYALRTHVCKPNRLRRYSALLRSPRPGGGILELIERRKQFGGEPGAVQALDPVVAHDGVAEALADLVLLHLEVHPEQLLDELDQRRLLATALLQRGAQLRQRGQHRGAGGVHHVLGVALDHRHRRLQAVDDGLALGTGHGADQHARADRVPHPLQIVGARQAGHAQQRAGVDLHLDRGQQLAEHPGHVVAQPRHAGELHGVGELVEDDPLEQLGLVGLERLGGQPQVRRDEQQARRARGVQQGDLVLAEDRATHEPDDAAR